MANRIAESEDLYSLNSSIAQTSPKNRLRIPALLAMLAILPLVTFSQTAAISPLTFQSGGKPIRVEAFYPATSGRHPAVLVLYGGLGMTLRPAGYRY